MPSRDKLGEHATLPVDVVVVVPWRVLTEKQRITGSSKFAVNHSVRLFSVRGTHIYDATDSFFSFGLFCSVIFIST